VNFSALAKKLRMCILTHPKSTFTENHILTVVMLSPQIFRHARKGPRFANAYPIWNKVPK